MKRNTEAEKRGRREEKGQTKRREKQAHIFQAPQAMAANARKRGWGGEKRNLFAKSCSHCPSALPPCTLPLALLQQLPHTHATPSPPTAIALQQAIDFNWATFIAQHCFSHCISFSLSLSHSSSFSLAGLFLFYTLPFFLFFLPPFIFPHFQHCIFPSFFNTHYPSLSSLPSYLTLYIFSNLSLYIPPFLSNSFYVTFFLCLSLSLFFSQAFFPLLLTSAVLLFTLYRTSYYNQSLTGKSDLSISLSLPLLPLQIHIYLLLFLCSISLLFLRHLFFISLLFAISLSISFYCSLCCTRYEDDTRKLLHKTLPHGRQVGRDCTNAPHSTPSLTTYPSTPLIEYAPALDRRQQLEAQRRADSFSFRFFFLLLFRLTSILFQAIRVNFSCPSLSLSLSLLLFACFLLFSLILSAYKRRTMRDDLKK